MPKHITKIEEYVKSGGNACPYCGGDQLGYGEIRGLREGETLPWNMTQHESPTNKITVHMQDVRCVECGSKWVDVYRLVTIKEVSHVSRTK